MGRHRRNPKKPLGRLRGRLLQDGPQDPLSPSEGQSQAAEGTAEATEDPDRASSRTSWTAPWRSADRTARVRRVNVRKRMAMTYVDKALKGDRQVFLAIVKLLEREPPQKRPRHAGRGGRDRCGRPGDHRGLPPAPQGRQMARTAPMNDQSLRALLQRRPAPGPGELHPQDRHDAVARARPFSTTGTSMPLPGTSSRSGAARSGG